MPKDESSDAAGASSNQTHAAKPRSMIFKVLLGVVGVIVLAVVVFVIVVAMQPSDFRVERSITIDASPDVVFGHVNDFHKWEDWSPWAERDPNAKATYAGPDAGKGAVFHWDGNDDVGEGSMTILESRPGEWIKIDLAFVRPMEDSATVEFTFKPDGEGTAVTWSMHGENNFAEKAFCMFMDLDSMIGEDFEKGLASMKSAVEDSPES